MSKRKTGIKILVLALVFCLVAALSIGCGNQTAPPADTGTTQPTDTGTTTPEPAPAPAPADQIVLRVAYHEPAGSSFDQAWQAFDKDLQEKTGGAARLELYPGEQLGKGADMVSMIVNGVTDIGWIAIAFFPGQFPVAEVLNLPMIGAPSGKVAAKSLWDFYETSPVMQEEFAQGMHLLCFCASSPQFISTSKAKVSAPSDAKGLKLRVAGSLPSKYIESIGGSPVAMTPPDMYEAVEKGVLDGMVFDWNGINSFKLTEVLYYSMNMTMVTVPHAIAINQATWDSLPADIQQALNELGGAPGSERFGGAIDAPSETVLAGFKALDGREMIDVSSDDKAKWKDAAGPIWDSWVSDMTAAGYDGQGILDTFRSILEKNS